MTTMPPFDAGTTVASSQVWLHNKAAPDARIVMSCADGRLGVGLYERPGETSWGPESWHFEIDGEALRTVTLLLARQADADGELGRIENENQRLRDVIAQLRVTLNGTVLR